MELNRLDIQDILDGYRKRRFTPTEVIEQYLKVIEDRNPELNAYLEVQPERTLERARALETRLQDASKMALFGVPIALKDNFLAEGWKTTAGSKILQDYQSPYTASSVQRLEAAGAIVLGKTNLDEFAMGSSTENSAFGPSKNPWDPTRVPGGSSGGSAVAVAAAMAPAALGTDTGGSIRQPASLCGVVGLKPSYGRVSRFGIVAFASSLDQVGPFTRTTWDSARLLEVMGGYHGKDATASRRVVPIYTDALSNYSIKNIRVGVARGWLEGVHPDVAKAFDESLKALEAEGAKIVDIELPSAQHALSVYYLIAPSEASSNLARYDGVHYGLRAKDVEGVDDLYQQSRGSGFGPEVKLRIMLGTYALSAGYYDAYYNKAGEVRRLIKNEFDEAFTRCDVIASPTSPTTAFGLGEKTDDPLTMYLSDVFTLPANLAGLPGISVPCGKDAKGLPIGLQLMGKSFDETLLLQVADAFEKVCGGFPIPDSGGVA